VAKIIILDITRGPSVKPERFGKEDVYVSYRDERMMMRTVEIPAEEALTPEGEVIEAKLIEAIKAQEAWRAKYIGKEIEISGVTHGEGEKG